MPLDPRSSTPTKIKKVSPAELMIIWADGRESHFPAPVLRRECPCAQCRDEITGARILLPMHVPDTLELRRIELVGQYALQFEWTDGHHTGIFSFDLLRQLGDEIRK
jgi:ATP-binding protein involved in chromosome partitioning